MKLGLNLASVQSESSSKYTLHEPGTYAAKIVDAEVKETAKKDGHVLILDLQTDKGFIAERINLANPNAEAVRIGLSRLKTIAKFIGHKNPDFIDDTDELLYGQITINVEVYESVYDGKTIKQNRIKSVLPYEGAKTEQVAPFSTTPVASVSQPSTRPSWMK